MFRTLHNFIGGGGARRPQNSDETRTAEGHRTRRAATALVYSCWINVRRWKVRETCVLSSKMLRSMVCFRAWELETSLFNTQLGDGSRHIGGGGSGRGDNCSYQQMESQRCEMVDGEMQCTKTRTELRKCPGRRMERKEGGRWVETDENEFGIGRLGGALDFNFDSFFGQIRDHLSGIRGNKSGETTHPSSMLHFIVT
mmetsp:Transcript_34202/g.47613  ORF Transcript_34202/g.47613 Transcript_34202/m.47613 type:complete len:198 (+) Transcript_34202:53-646(+)